MKTLKDFGINIVHTKTQDATIYKEEYFEKFDKILLDVPCLGLGVLKRKPDIKWKKAIEDIDNISKIQYKILNTCSKYLKKGGQIVYSTCSILDSENKNIIFKFLKENENFEIEKIIFGQDNKDNKVEKCLKKYVTKDGFIKLYQNESTDGFFISKLVKKGRKATMLQ